MRPLKLIMQAFGPYADTEIIDFAKLENRTMFVISGKTGSGKTTIFDGISFAIYGRASGDDRGGTDLRSQFAEDDLATEVSLEFSLKGKTYYIWRAPQQEKKKSRGDGFTIVNAKAELYMIDSIGERKLLAANVRETDEKIKELIQLDANQFRQILMIPQGEFRKLLISDSKEKEAILQKLFHTEVYKQIEEKLREYAGNLKREVEFGVAERNRHLRNIVYKHNEVLDEALNEESLNDTYILLQLYDLIAQLKAEVEIVKKNMEKQKIKRDDAKRNVDAAEDLIKQITIRDLLVEQKNTLLNKQQEIEQKKNEIDLAHKANKLQHQEDLCQRLKGDLDQFNSRLIREKEQLVQLESQHEKAHHQLTFEENQSGRRDQLNTELTMLKNGRDHVLSYASRKAEVKKVEENLKLCQTQISKDKSILEKKSVEIKDEEIRLKELEKLQIQTFEFDKKVMNLEVGLQSLRTLTNIIENKTSLEEKIKIKKSELDHAKKVVDDARETLKVLEDQWMTGHAGHLAASLVDGQPCPVCGSSDHPNPAADAIIELNANDIKSAKENVESALSYHSNLERDWMKMNVEEESLTNKLNDTLENTLSVIPNFTLEKKDVFLHDHEQEVAKMKGILNEARLKIKQLPSIEKNISDIKIVMEEGRAKIDQLQEKERSLSISFSEKVLEFENVSRSIPEDLREIDQYDKKVISIEKEIEKIDHSLKIAREYVSQISEKVAVSKGTIKNLQDNVESVTEALNKERKTFLEKLEEENFTSFKHYNQSKRNVSEMNELEHFIRHYYEELRSITDRLSDYNLRMQDKEKPNLEQLQMELEESDRLFHSLGEQHSHLNVQIEKNKEIQLAVTNINKQIKDLENEYELVGHLSDITRGQNTYKLSFERFVLASFLDGILDAANVRLIKMTNGRYRLLRKKDRSKGNVQSGLELLVYDQYTGQERHVKTLSGGESFKSALALALGLSDIVQEYAGGVSLETMFIDEGFGTLDPESLDQAIEALLDIQSSGRLVGIISHVPELKERIDVRLEVMSDHNGSKTEFQFIN